MLKLIKKRPVNAALAVSPALGLVAALVAVLMG